MNPHHTERLAYMPYDPHAHDAMLWEMHQDTVSCANVYPQIPRPITHRFHTELVNYKANQLLFVILAIYVNHEQSRPEELEPVGHLSLSSPTFGMDHHRTSELSLVIHSGYQNQDFGLEAMKWVLGWGFREANLHRIGVSVLGWNRSAYDLYKAAGLREEGRKRESLFHEGRYWDEIFMGILAHEWQHLQGQGQVAAATTLTNGH